MTETSLSPRQSPRPSRPSKHPCFNPYKAQYSLRPSSPTTSTTAHDNHHNHTQPHATAMPHHRRHASITMQPNTPRYPELDVSPDPYNAAMFGNSVGNPWTKATLVQSLEFFFFFLNQKRSPLHPRTKFHCHHPRHFVQPPPHARARRLISPSSPVPLLHPRNQPLSNRHSICPY